MQDALAVLFVFLAYELVVGPLLRRWPPFDRLTTRIARGIDRLGGDR